jgi:HK97 family phage major capsid protein
MTELEIREKILDLQTTLENVIANGEAEQRELTEEESNQMVDLRSQIDAAKAELAKVEEENRKLAEQKNHKEITKKNTMKEIRLFDLIKGIVNNNLTDEQRAYVNGNQINFRAPAEAIAATVENYGKENVPEDKMRLEVAIRNASVLNKLGATWFGNAVGNIRIPKYNGSNVYWADSENANAADGKNTFSEVTLSPKRLTAYITISRQFLAQSPEDAEAILISDLAAAVAEKFDQTVFGKEEGSDAQPEGLFYEGKDYLVTGKTIDSITFDDVLDLEEAVEEKNGTDFIFVADPKVKYALRGTQMASGLQFVWDRGEIDGRKAVVSNSVEEGGLICFDPKDLAVATWDNGMFITVDPYTLAGKNQIKVTVNYLCDATLKGDRISGAVFE